MLDMTQQGQQILTQLLQKQQQQQQPVFAGSAASSNTSLGARDLSKILKQPPVFSRKTKDEGLIRWPAWSWEFDEYLRTLETDFHKEFKHIKEHPKTPLPSANHSGEAEEADKS